MRDLDKITAVDKLLFECRIEDVSESITEMWESWITNPVNDGANSDIRADRLYTYKALIDFLKCLAG